MKGDKEEFAKLLNVEDIEEEEAELDSSISNPPSLSKWGPNGDPHQQNGDPKSACFQN